MFLDSWSSGLNFPNFQNTIKFFAQDEMDYSNHSAEYSESQSPRVMIFVEELSASQPER